MNKKYFDANKELWDEFAKLHYETETDGYSVESFLKGKTTLKTYELKEMGNVKGKTLLHLQCHFGLDTLSWEREGAKVTGIDISSEGIRLAKLLAKRANLKGNFIETNLYDLPKVLSEKFDIVYTSIGVLCWLNDLKEWGRIIASFLKSGGFFYIAEIHPFSMVFDNETKGIKDLQIFYNYFHDPVPIEFTADGSYASDTKKIEPKKEYEWAHSMSDIINALIEAGLKIEFLNEYPFSVWKQFPFMERNDDGYCRLKDQKAEIPLLFTLKATK
ncbi:MAG: class I SAM-dependent methyltransferase [Candidatus Heimdallarchaeota archaeon]|nr:class I SAM-dependent methyltransferase [Candidatus Heimdallarchaeota archaeon]MBY8994392.1 class I SAM-dependent methyltransferase [Candidatus Heimdallarchaeota archaeon]